MENIKTCPFCGKEVEPEYYEMLAYPWTIVCRRHHDATSASCITVFAEGETKEDAIAAWNARA